MLRKEWLRPPRSLLVILFLLTLVSISSLAWFGRKLIQQERLLEHQRAQQRLQEAADQVSTAIKSTLAESGDRLSAWAIAPPDDAKPERGLLLIFNNDLLTVRPHERLLYWPFPSSDREADSDAFAEGESLEFVQVQPRKAIESYERLLASSDPAVRAGALMRLGRVLRQLNDGPRSMAVYSQLAGMTGVKVAGTPAQVVGRHALFERSGSPTDALAFRNDLLGGRWRLTRGQFEYYWTESSRIANRQDAPPAAFVAVAEASREIWAERGREPALRGHRTLWIGSRPFLVIWRGAPESRAVLILEPESLLKFDETDEKLSIAAVDHDGRIVAGRTDGANRVIRTAAETQLPWTLHVSALPAAAGAAILARERLLLLGIAVMALFLLTCTYLIARTMRREMEIARLQADFVSAVSHEFRSPLTSMRQLSEILALGRVPNEERRQTYYQLLVGETERLQRLIEMLLDFGRMEAGRREYRFEPLDVSALVLQVVAEFDARIASSGRQIEVKGPANGCPVDADCEALSVALRNLLDNALKYSPQHPTVWVEWASENRHVAIRVRDKGSGIALSERKRIFEKFVRGSAAVEARVKGAGVGLAMVSRIVAAHGGEIRVTSEPGDGSTFTMLLPAAQRS